MDKYIHTPPKIGENGQTPPPLLIFFPSSKNLILSDSWNNSLTEGSEVSQNFPSVDRKPVWEYETGHKWSSSKSLSIHVLHQQLGALM